MYIQSFPLSGYGGIGRHNGDNFMKQYLYKNQKDGRSRIVIVEDNGKRTSKSYPRFLVEQSIGRRLSANEDVHHKDGDVTNNCIENLEIIRHGEHQRLHSVKYTDSEETCCVCGKRFIYSGKQWQRYYSDLRRGRNRKITCSKKCAGIVGSKKNE